MSKHRIFPPRNTTNYSSVKEFSDDSDEDNLNVYASLESFKESDNDIKSIISEQARKYRNLTIKIKKNERSGERYAVLAFDNMDALSYFKRAILEKRDRIIVYDKVLFFKFSSKQFKHQRGGFRSDTFRKEGNYERRPLERKIDVSRTLFIGNIEDDTDENDLRRTFEPYGEILEISIKHPQNHRGFSYAFIKFRKLSDAVHARDELQETEIGRNRMKIGFGKVTPRHALWIGGLNSSVDEEELVSEVRRCSEFAAHKYIPNENIAYFVFETINDCRRAYLGIKDTRIGHSNSKIEVDYADPLTEIKDLMDRVKFRDNVKRSRSTSRSREYYDEGRRKSRSRESIRGKSPRRRSSTSSHRSRRRSRSHESRRSRSRDFSSRDHANFSNVHNNDKKYFDRRIRSGDSSLSDTKIRTKTSRQDRFDDNTAFSTQQALASTYGGNSYEPILSLRKIINPYPIVWKGGFAVKSHVSYVSLHLVCGSVDAVSTMVHQATLGGNDPKLITLTKRFPLLPDRIADLRSKLATAIASRDCCILIGQTSKESLNSSSMSEKPISSLISYFKGKQAAGIGSIGKISIYSFPPSPFTQEQLSTLMPHAIKALHAPNEDYLMVVISR